jgi:hypothetical protein
MERVVAQFYLDRKFLRLQIFNCMSDIFNRVLDYWKTNNVSLAPRLDAATLREKFNQSGLNLAEDFIDFLAVTGGMNFSAEDPNTWSCWSIDRILKDNRSYPRPGVMFADWCINSLFHVVRQESENVSSVWVDQFSDDEPFKVADSLTEFFERYLAKDSNIFVL